MDNIRSITRELGRQSPREVLEEALAHVDDYDAVTLVVGRTEAAVEKGEDSHSLLCSDMTVADANYLLDAGKFILMHGEDDEE